MCVVLPVCVYSSTEGLGERENGRLESAHRTETGQEVSLGYFESHSLQHTIHFTSKIEYATVF